MARLLFALAALLAAFSASEAAVARAADEPTATPTAVPFRPLQNPRDKKCIITTAYNVTLDQFTLKTGKCTSDDAVKFVFKGNGTALTTDDGYCLGPVKPTGKDKTLLVLGECDPKDKGQNWTSIGVNQWKNGYGACMEKVGSDLVEKKCANLTADDEKSKQQWVFWVPPPPPKPTVPEILCADWQAQYQCPKWTDPLNPYVYPTLCVGADDYACNTVCCVPQEQLTCFDFNINCGNGYTLVNYWCGNYGYPPCNFDTCCDPKPYKRCDTEVDCGPNYIPISQQCGNSASQPPCTFQNCCKPKPPPVITCSKWNNCKKGYALTYNANYIKCTSAPGSGYPQCSNDLCCDPVAYYCSDYFSQGYRCKQGFNPIPDAKVVQCDPYLSGDCNSMCCTKPVPTPTTCSKWNKCNANFQLKTNANSINCFTDPAGNPVCSNNLCCDPVPPPSDYYCSDYFADGNKCKPGFNPIPDANQVTCLTNVPGDCNSMCCIKPEPTPITCSAWNQCNPNFQLKDNANSINCFTDPAGAPLCANALCCDPAPPAQYGCADWANDGGQCQQGYQPVPGGNVVQCSKQTPGDCASKCCAKVQPTPTTCDAWNQCNPNFQLKDNAANVDCFTDPAGAPQCANALCCDPMPPADYFCTDYFNDGNSCKQGFNQVPDAGTIKCQKETSGDCNSMCCELLPTCADWSANNQCTQNGYVLVDNPDKVTGDDEATCCEKDTCEKWLKRDDKQTGLTGQQTCNNDGGVVVQRPDQVNCYDPNVDPSNRTDNDLISCDEAQCCPVPVPVDEPVPIDEPVPSADGN